METELRIVSTPVPEVPSNVVIFKSRNQLWDEENTSSLAEHHALRARYFIRLFSSLSLDEAVVLWGSIYQYFKSDTELSEEMGATAEDIVDIRERAEQALGTRSSLLELMR